MSWGAFCFVLASKSWHRGGMFFAIAKFVFEELLDPRELKALVARLKARFPIAVRSYHPEGSSGFIVAVLDDKEQSLSRTLDAIAVFAEGAGLGRLTTEEVLFDHIDNLDANPPS